MREAHPILCSVMVLPPYIFLSAHFRHEYAQDAVFMQRYFVCIVRSRTQAQTPLSRFNG